MPDDPLSRRSLLRFDFGWAREVLESARSSERPDSGPVKAAMAWRWERGAASLHRAWEPLAAVLCDAAGVAEGTRVLDAATGDGNVALEAARRGAEVMGCDTSPGQLARAHERDGAAAVEWCFGDVEDLPFGDGLFDVVISAYGATLAPSPRRVARELLRVLAPGGLLVMSAAAPRSLLAVVLDLAQAGPGALPRGLPSPLAWGRRDIAEERIEAVAPGTAVEVLRHSLPLRFASRDAAWEAFAGPFGLETVSRAEFDDAVALRSEHREPVVFDEPVTVIRARRPA